MSELSKKCEICVGDFCNGCNPPDYPFFERKHNIDPGAWYFVWIILYWDDFMALDREFWENDEI